MAVRIVLLHATPVAMQPVHTAFAERWPEAEIINLLDDGLSFDRAREGQLSEAMITRFVRFGQYGFDMGADGILATCSAFGPAIDAMAKALPVPVLKPNEAMFQAALQYGQRIGMLATFGPAIGTMTEEFAEYAAQIGSHATLKTVLVEGAIGLLRTGDAQGHNRLVAEHKKHHPVLALGIDDVLSGRIGSDDLVAFIGRHQGEAPLVYSSGDPQEVAAAQARYGQENVSAALDALFGDTACKLVAHGVRRIVVGGGETSGAVVSALNLGALTIGAEIDTGVPALVSQGEHPIALALKSGNFGSPDFFAKAVNVLRG